MPVTVRVSGLKMAWTTIPAHSKAIEEIGSGLHQLFAEMQNPENEPAKRYAKECITSVTDRLEEIANEIQKYLGNIEASNRGEYVPLKLRYNTGIESETVKNQSKRKSRTTSGLSRGPAR